MWKFKFNSWSSRYSGKNPIESRFRSFRFLSYSRDNRVIIPSKEGEDRSRLEIFRLVEAAATGSRTFPPISSYVLTPQFSILFRWIFFSVVWESVIQCLDLLFDIRIPSICSVEKKKREGKKLAPLFLNFPWSEHKFFASHNHKTCRGGRTRR